MHENNLAATFTDHVLVLEQCVKVIKRHRQLLFSEPLGGILDKLHAVLLGEIQYGTLCACIEYLLDVFLPFYISPGHHRYPYHSVHPFHQVDGFLMLVGIVGQIEYDQFIGAVVAVTLRQLHRVFGNHRAVVEPAYRLSPVDKYTGDQPLITHDLSHLLYKLPLIIRGSLNLTSTSFPWSSMPL